MSDVLVLLRVSVNDAQVEKINLKRRRLGVQTRTATEEVINRTYDALHHDFMFDKVEVVKQITE